MISYVRIVLGMLSVAFVLLVLVAACGDEKSSTDPSSTGPTASPGPTLAGNPMAIESARQYLKETGVEDKKGDLTDPMACSQVKETSNGRFCVHDGFTISAPGLVRLIIGEKDNPDKQTWEIRLEPGDAGWHVTTAMPFGSRE